MASGWVTVTGPPSAICSLKMPTTEPRLPRTLPKRTHEKRVFDRAARLCTTCSAKRLVAPITLVGLIALSVEIITNDSTACSSASSASCLVANTLLRTASHGKRSIIGTCL